MKTWMLLFCPLVVVLSACSNAPENLVSNSPGNSESLPIVGVTPTPFPSASPSATPVATPNPATSRKIALVYDGTGACEEDCAKAAAETATLAGFTPKIVGPKALGTGATSAQIASLFDGVAIWVQPGGYARQAYEAMTPALRNALIAFVKNGGGYVGFCAGGFIATNYIGSTGSKGLGIFPGSTAPLGTNSLLETVKWEGKTRSIYFEGGPYFYNLPKTVEVTAVYDDGKTVAAARTTFGSGRVYLAGPHPEAPSWWGTDPDGSDRDLAAGMMKWAAGL